MRFRTGGCCKDNLPIFVPSVTGKYKVILDSADCCCVVLSEYQSFHLTLNVRATFEKFNVL